MDHHLVLDHHLKDLTGGQNQLAIVLDRLDLDLVLDHQEGKDLV